MKGWRILVQSEDEATIKDIEKWRLGDIRHYDFVVVGKDEKKNIAVITIEKGGNGYCNVVKK